MRSRAIPVVLGAMALTATALAGTATAASGPVATTSGGSTAPSGIDGSVNCKKAFNLGTPNGDGVTAQNFEAAYDAFDAYGAASFKLGRKKCLAQSVLVSGQGAVGSALYVAVVGNAGGLPDKGNVLCEATISGSGPVWKVPFTCTLPKKTAYFLIAQTTANFGTQGQWFWNTTNDQITKGDAWKNPGGGFGTACTDWGDLGTCLPFPDYEFIFALQKDV